jgi:3-hydroxymyristoyl/3-hydroxydecanoyl-(acyl carrier protein) dehydratase
VLTPLSVGAISLDCQGVLMVRPAFTNGHLVTTGDRVQMVGAGQFRLMVRADGGVKTDGKRVSLSRVESALTTLPGVAEAAAVSLDSEGAETLGAVLVLDAAGGAELARRGAFQFMRDLHEALEGLEPAERPQRWRFVGRLPVNAQGKRVEADLAKLFDAVGLLTSLDAHVTMTAPDKADIAFGLKPDLAFFEGHFPGQGVLAGVAQTHIAIRLGEEVWGFLPNSHEVSRLKFRRVMMPGDTVVLTLTRDVAKGKLRFSFLANGLVASEGLVGGG